MKSLSFRTFLGDRQGAVAVVAAFAMIPLVFAVGMAVDYANCARKWSAMNSAADAAALAAVSSAMIGQSDSVAQTAAQNAFNGNAAAISDLIYNPASGLTITIADSGSTRLATVSYTAQVANFFGSILGQSTTTIHGHSQATNAGTTTALNTDFYMLIDTSPSMAVPGTTAGIQTMIANTRSQGGCAFACHEANPAADGLGNPNGEDNYALARSLGVILRIDYVQTAVHDFITNAQSSEGSGTNYRIAIDTFDHSLNSIWAISSNLSGALTASANVQLLEVYQWYYLTKSNYNDDGDTDWNTAISGMNTLMPNPGNGTSASGDKPKEVLFIVTDGVNDSYSGGNRTESVMSTSMCTTIKNRGIQIAIIYTDYLPLPYNSSASDISSFQPNIGPDLQSCASPGLYFEVSSDPQISAAMISLFNTAVGQGAPPSVPHLTQ